MKRRTSIRPVLDMLEDRCCPSATAGVSGGTLTVTDAQSANLAINEVAAGSFRVWDGSNLVGTYTVTKNVNVQLSGTNNTVVVDFQGLAAPGDIDIHLAGTQNNSVAIRNGTIRGNLNVYGGQQTDTVDLGSAAGTALQVNAETWIQLNGGSGDSLEVHAGVTLKGDLNAVSANHVTLDAGSSVGGTASVSGGPAGNVIAFDGKVGHLARFTGSMQATDQVTVGATAVLGSLTVLFADGQSTLDMQGQVLDKFYMQTGAGNDQIDLAGSIGGTVNLQLGSGNNTVDFNGIMGTVASPTTLTLDSGAGADQVTFDNGMNLHGTANVCLGAGNDTFTLDSGSRFTSATINGGGGTNTFVGNANRVKAINFQVFEQ
jgi:hypothetical protein